MKAYITEGKEKHAAFYPTSDPVMLRDVHVSA
jgi:hypothetical protein